MSDTSKLGMLDEYGARNFIIPAEVRGYFQKKRKIVHVILLIVFLAIPWVTWQGQQLLLLDIASRRFYIFGLNFAAHDAPMLFIFLIIATLGLAYVTAVFGRIWCGWACPQTVFIDLVYRQIEIWVEGTHLQRRQLRRDPMSFGKAKKLILKWTLFLIVSSIFAHSFVAYFVGSDVLINMIKSGPTNNLFYFNLIFVFTLVTLFDFAWFREQFCVIVCPYGRIQSVLMDTQSLSVVYDHNRGEPRKGIALKQKSLGDCVSCNRCVAVCPTGIDIRNGQQMECIGCTACIDACDEIMDKVQKPKGLIRYDSVSGKKPSLLKGRPLFYLIGILLACCSFVFLLSNRKSFDVTLLRALESPYKIMTNASGEQEVTNHFRLRIKNQWNEALAVEIVGVSDNADFIIPQTNVSLKPLELKTLHFFVKFRFENVQSLRENLPHVLVRTTKNEVEKIYINLISPN